MLGHCDHPAGDIQQREKSEKTEESLNNIFHARVENVNHNLRTNIANIIELQIKTIDLKQNEPSVYGGN